METTTPLPVHGDSVTETTGPHCRTLVSAVTVALLLGAAAPAQSETFTPHALGTIPDDISLEAPPITAPDGTVVTHVSRLMFAPDGSRFAYVGYREGLAYPVIGEDVPESPYHYVSEPSFSADSSTVVFRVGNRKSQRTEEWWPLVNGEKGKKFDWIGEISVGPDGTLAFWEQPGAKIVGDGSYDRGGQVLHFGKRTSRKYEDATSLHRPVISANGKTVVGGAMKGGRWFALAMSDRGKQQLLPKRGVGMVGAVAVSSDGKQVACIGGEGPPMPPGVPRGALPGTEWRIHFGQKELGKGLEGVGAPVIEPAKGRALAYKALGGSKMGIGFDSADPELEFAYVSTPVWSPDGKSVAYAAYSASNHEPMYELEAETGARLAVGKAKLATQRPGKKPALLETEYAAIRYPTFSADGKQVAFAARDADGKWRIVVGDRSSAAFDEVGPPVFDSESERIAFGARSGAEVSWVVLE